MIRISTGQSPCGKEWDHKGKTELVKIFISYDDRAIKFLQCLYHENGNLVLSDPPDDRGPQKKFSTNQVNLQYPGEFLTSLKGTCRSDSYGLQRLTSIEFDTNLGRHGPFGQAGKRDKRFDFQLGDHRGFGGFHGTIGPYGLESIGVYVKPITSLSDLNSDEKVKIPQICQ